MISHPCNFDNKLKETIEIEKSFKIAWEPFMCTTLCEKIDKLAIPQIKSKISFSSAQDDFFVNKIQK